jgi:uncharacterized protein YdaU (DUF1376 family)
MTMSTDTPTRERFPYFPFFVDDWLSSDAVTGFTLEQQAAYLLLLIRQWKAADCVLPADEIALARWSKLGARWKKLGRPIIAQCFTRTDGGYVNEKLRGLWNHSRERSGKASIAATLRWREQRERKQPARQRDPTWSAMVAAYGRCLRCGKSDRDVKLCRDHVIPRYQGGADTPQNWQPLCTSCNSSKGPDRTDYRRGLPETDPAWLPKD